jgi:periplasmic mercuric ion binding protein
MISYRKFFNSKTKTKKHNTMKKHLILLLFLGVATFGINNVNAQNCCSKKNTSCGKMGSSTAQTAGVQNSLTASAVKDTLTVYGACGMCKTRIEKTAKGITGVTDAKWDAATNILTYSYTGTVNKMDVSNALLKVGHDTGYGKAPDDVYNKLPGCCQYRK